MVKELDWFSLLKQTTKNPKITCFLQYSKKSSPENGIIALKKACRTFYISLITGDLLPVFFRITDSTSQFPDALNKLKFTFGICQWGKKTAFI